MIGTALGIGLAAASAAGSIASAKISSNAAKDAAKTQTTAANQAAADTKAASQEALNYINQSRAGVPTGNASPAYMDLSRRMGLLTPSTPAPVSGMATGVAPMMNPYARLAQPVGWASAPAQPANTVMMRAPDGTTKAVPRDQVEHYTSRGARAV